MAKIRAPEFADGLTWLQSRPLQLRSLRGKVILVDFWTYSCVNCVRTMPHLARWHERYGDKGLVIIGVHTPEFAFEKEQANVERAIKNLGIAYPVVLDPEYVMWNAYANRWWPRKFLINAEGVIVYDHVGEGGYAETEAAIQKALVEAGATKLPAIASDEGKGSGVCYRTTPETYCGYLRGHVGNEEHFLPDAEEAFTDPAAHDQDALYLHGHWRVGNEFIEHARTTPTASEYALLKYEAFGVNVVAASATKKGVELEVELDGRPLSADMYGADIKPGPDGKAILSVKEARLYRVVLADTYHLGTLRLRTRDAGVRLFAFTFESCGRK